MQMYFILFNVVVQSLSHIQLFVNPWTGAYQASLSSTVSLNLLKFMTIESVMLSKHLILCHHLLLLSSIFVSIRVFSSESVLLISCPKYYSFSISPSSEYSGLISFRIDWLDLLAVQGTLKSLLQHHSLKASVLWHSDFFLIQLYCLHMTSGKTTALILQTFVGKEMSLLLNMMSRFVIAFLSRSKCLNIMAAVTVCSDCEAQEKKMSLLPLFPFCLSQNDRTRCHDLSFLKVEFQASFFTLLFHSHQEAF